MLRERASRASLQGVLIATVAVLFATLAVSYLSTQSISLEGVVEAQRSNFALWVLDLMPLAFAYLGQYSSYTLAKEASDIVREQTLELRTRTLDLERQAAFAATHDQVTELPNRALLTDRIERAITAAGACNGRFGVLLLSVENLKDVGNTLGSNASDLLVKRIAARLKGWIHPTDSLARLEPHTFAFLLGGLQCHETAERIAAGVQRVMEPTFQVGDISVDMHSSIGISIYPEHGEDAETLVQRAAIATYIGSRTYNGFAIYSPAFDDQSPRRLTLMSELKQAIERGRFLLYHQPKIDIASGRLIGSEALIRWRHHRDGFIPPEEFIPLAERTRLIRLLTRWVLEQALGDCALLHRAGFDWNVSLNLSALDLHDPDLPDLIAGMMERTGARAEWISLEITESSLMADPVRALTVLERIHGLGVRLAIDDFGTGYSSLAYLTRLPVSELKIDKSFVINMAHTASDEVIVRATVELGHSLGLKVTAEGVETEDSLARLHRMGCDVGQGFLFSKPRPLPEILAWQEASRWPATRALPAESATASEQGARAL